MQSKNITLTVNDAVYDTVYVALPGVCLLAYAEWFYVNFKIADV
jgi:hypothetical protein